jgi:hypothetical protein
LLAERRIEEAKEPLQDLEADSKGCCLKGIFILPHDLN